MRWIAWRWQRQLPAALFRYRLEDGLTRPGRRARWISRLARRGGDDAAPTVTGKLAAQETTLSAGSDALRASTGTFGYIVRHHWHPLCVHRWGEGCACSCVKEAKV